MGLLPLTPVLQINVIIVTYICIHMCAYTPYMYINKHIVCMYMCVLGSLSGVSNRVLCPPKEMFGHNKRVHQSLVIPSLSVH